MRSLRSPVPTWLLRSAAMAAACSSWARSSSRALSTRMAFARFLICERSSWQVTTSPGGRGGVRAAPAGGFAPPPPPPPGRHNPRRLGDGHALPAVAAALELQPAPRAAPLDEEDDLLVAAHAGHVGVHDLDLPALALGVLRVHAREVGGEQRGLVAARARPDLDEDVLVVVRVAREQETLELLLELRLAPGELLDLGLRAPPGPPPTPPLPH